MHVVRVEKKQNWKKDESNILSGPTLFRFWSVEAISETINLEGCIHLALHRTWQVDLDLASRIIRNVCLVRLLSSLNHSIHPICLFEGNIKKTTSVCIKRSNKGPLLIRRNYLAVLQLPILPFCFLIDFFYFICFILGGNVRTCRTCFNMASRLRKCVEIIFSSSKTNFWPILNLIELFLTQLLSRRIKRCAGVQENDNRNRQV